MSRTRQSDDGLGSGPVLVIGYGLTGAAAAAADEALADEEATLLADDHRARFTAVVQGRRRFEPGERVEFVLRPDTLHLFDPSTGDAVR